MENTVFDYQATKTAGLLLRVFDHPLRQQIITLIDENMRISVTDICKKMELVPSVASQQLAILRLAEIVKTERESRVIYYSLNYARIAWISESLASERLNSLQQRPIND